MPKVLISRVTGHVSGYGCRDIAFSLADSFLPGQSRLNSMIKSGRACITHIWSNRYRYRSSALVVDVLGNLGRTDKPTRIPGTAWFCRFAPRYIPVFEKTSQWPVYCPVRAIAALAVPRSSGLSDLAQP